MMFWCMCSLWVKLLYCNPSFIYWHWNGWFTPVVNLTIKLGWYEKFWPHELAEANWLVLHEVHKVLSGCIWCITCSTTILAAQCLLCQWAVINSAWEHCCCSTRTLMPICSWYSWLGGTYPMQCTPNISLIACAWAGYISPWPSAWGRHRSSSVLAGMDLIFVFNTSDLSNIDPTGQPLMLPYSFLPCYGYLTYPGLIYSLWASVLIS